MEMAVRRAPGSYENDCATAAFQNVLRKLESKSSYIFSERNFSFSEDLWSGDSRFKVLKSDSPIVDQRKVPQWTHHYLDRQELDSSDSEADCTPIEETQNGRALDALPHQDVRGSSPATDRTTSKEEREEIRIGRHDQISNSATGRNASIELKRNRTLSYREQDTRKPLSSIQSSTLMKGSYIAFYGQDNPAKSKRSSFQGTKPSEFLLKAMSGGKEKNSLNHRSTRSSWESWNWSNYHQKSMKEDGRNSSWNQKSKVEDGGYPSRNQKTKIEDGGYQNPKSKVEDHGHTRWNLNSETQGDRYQRSKPAIEDDSAVPRSWDYTKKRPKREHRFSASVNDVCHLEQTRENPSKKAATDAGLKAEMNLRMFIIKLEDDECLDIKTDQLKLWSVRKRYPKLEEAIPEIGGPDKTLKWSLNAAHLVMKFLFNGRLNSKPPTNGRTVIEAMALALTWEVADFRTQMQPFLVQKLQSQQAAREFYVLAKRLGDLQLCRIIKDQAKSLSGEFSVLKGTPRFRQKACSVSCQPYVESLEFKINLAPESNTLMEGFDRDIECEIEFLSVLGSFAITGFQLAFAVDDLILVDGSSKLKVDYQLENKRQNSTVQEVKPKPLLPTVIVHLGKDFVVRQGEKCKLTVEIDMKPGLCFVLEENTVMHNSRNAKFQLSLKSNFKAKGDTKMRFFIEKLFYREVNVG